jgi:hypothetical protein
MGDIPSRENCMTDSIEVAVAAVETWLVLGVKLLLFFLLVKVPLFVNFEYLHFFFARVSGSDAASGLAETSHATLSKACASTGSGIDKALPARRNVVRRVLMRNIVTSVTMKWPEELRFMRESKSYDDTGLSASDNTKIII